MRADLVDAILTRCGVRGGITATEAGGGSSFHTTCVVVTPAGRFFLKHNTGAWPGHFEAEALGLEALAGAVERLRVPDVIGFADVDEELGSFLLLEHLELGSRGDRWAEDLGRALAELHEPRATETYGFPVDGYCGSTPQPNPRSENWLEFYGQARLAQLGRHAATRGLSKETLGRLDRLVGRLDEWVGEVEGPCLIHGDLWSGNAMATAEGRPALIDPAAYWAEREAELGMMSLFGGFPARLWEAYQEVRPLRKGWRHRLGLYELYHLLNHFVMFGGGYAADVDRVLRQYVG